MPPSLTNDATHYINYTYILLVNKVAKKKNLQRSHFNFLQS